MQNSGRSLNLRHILVAIGTLGDFPTLMERISMDRVENMDLAGPGCPSCITAVLLLRMVELLKEPGYGMADT
ncbi:MAG: hypothetical protein JXL20_01395 [Deltaproteobacteria bacterium]|nr:hypothetical protein [Deltaproteobacteria bacterium]